MSTFQLVYIYIYIYIYIYRRVIERKRVEVARRRISLARGGSHSRLKFIAKRRVGAYFFVVDAIVLSNYFAVRIPTWYSSNMSENRDIDYPTTSLHVFSSPFHPCMKRYTFSSQRTINDGKDSRDFQQLRSRSRAGKEAVTRLASTGENDDFLPGEGFRFNGVAMIRQWSPSLDEGEELP